MLKIMLKLYKIGKTYPIGPHNGGLLYTRLEGAEEETVGGKVGPAVEGNANDWTL